VDPLRRTTVLGDFDTLSFSQFLLIFAKLCLSVQLSGAYKGTSSSVPALPDSQAAMTPVATVVFSSPASRFWAFGATQP